MPDRTEAGAGAPDCVTALLNRLDVLVRMLDYGDALAVYRFHPALDEVGLCPALGLRDDGRERPALEPFLDEVRTALGAYRRQPGLSRGWAVGHLRAVVAEARRQLDATSADALETALRSPRCADCAHAAGCAEA